jgi:hypothetical protein
MLDFSRWKSELVTCVAEGALGEFSSRVAA